MRSVANTVKDRVTAGRAGRQLRRLAAEGGGKPENLVGLTYSFRYRSPLHPWPLKPIKVQALQVPEEFRAVARYLADRRVRRILEIGTSSGGTLFVWSSIAGPGGVSVSLDLPEGDYVGSQPLGNEGYPAWRGVLYRTFVPEGHTLHLMKGDSHTQEMLADVRSVAGPEPFDFLFIDGDHSYSGVKRDFEMYSPLVKKGGHVAFHDIVHRPPHTQCEVDRFWNEVRASYPHEEFIKDRNQGWGGIGVLTV